MILTGEPVVLGEKSINFNGRGIGEYGAMVKY